MPPYVMVAKDHLKQVLAGEKRFLKMGQVKFINAPNYDETGVKNLYDKVVQLPGMAPLFPDKYPKGRTCCKAYMYNCWNSIHPEEFAQVIEYANAQRYTV